MLPISAQDALAEVVSYSRHVFTDGIWASVSVVARHKSRYKGYPECGSAITFKNGFFIAGTLCYTESEPFSEPELTDEVVYSDEKRTIRKLWTWNVKSMYEDNETGLLKVLIAGDSFNSSGKSVFPPRYERIAWCRDHKHFFTCSPNRCEMYIVETPHPTP